MGEGELPTITIVFLVFNRREELRRSLHEMLEGSDYPRELLEVIVVDNASSDGASDMVREEFPGVRLIVRDVNVGTSGWNDGFDVASGELVLALDDDCFLPGDGLRRAVEALRAHDADLESFAIGALSHPDHRWNEGYRTGLLSFWGCAVLMKREVLAALGGFDPEIFVWAHELEFMVRFFDAGFRHLHNPEIVAIHMKEVSDEHWSTYQASRAYRINARHFAYIAAKLLAPRDAAEAFVALATRNVRDAARIRPAAIRGLPHTLAGFVHGLRHRRPVSNPEVSRVYRRNFGSFASWWWLSRSFGEIVRDSPRALRARLTGRPSERPPGRLAAYYEERSRYYPATPSVLKI